MCVSELQRQAARERAERDDDWSQNPDLNSEDDPNEVVSLVHIAKPFSLVYLDDYCDVNDVCRHFFKMPCKHA